MTAKKAYIYTRVSTSMQIDGYSLDAQEARIRQFASAFGIEIVETYQDAGKSGKSILGRTEFQRMLSDIETKKDEIDCVLVFKLSRFGRSAADTLQSLALMENYGVHLICVDDSLDSSKDSGKLVITILSAVAEMERENIISQTMSGKNQKAREGKWNGGFAPIGYTLKNGELQVDQEEAKIVRLIFDKFVNTDMGSNGVARFLANLDIQVPLRHNRKTTHFSSTTISRILENPVYAGKIAYGRRKSRHNKLTGKTIVTKSDNYILSDGVHQAIIDNETWGKAQIKRKNQTNKYQRVNPEASQNVYILSTLIKCPFCNSGLYGNKSGKKKNNKENEYYQDYFYYACKHRKMLDGYKCNFKKQIRIRDIECEVLTILKELMSAPELSNKLQEKIKIQVDTNEIDKLLEQYNSHNRKLNGTKLNLIMQLDSLDVEDRNYQYKYQDLNMRLDSIYDKISEIQELIIETEKKREAILSDKITSENLYNIFLNFGSLLEMMEDIDKKRLCQMLIEKVEIYPEKNNTGRWVKTIHFQLPIIANNIDYILDKGTYAEDITNLEERISAIEAEMTTCGADFTRLSDLQKELDEANEQLLEKYERYEYLSELD